MQRKINLLLLLFSLIGGAIGFFAGELVLDKLADGWPRFVVVGLYFGIVALFIGLFSLLAELLSPRLNGQSWRQRYTGLSWKLLVPATLALLFVVGGLVQLVYGLQFGLKPVKDIVLAIDNSGSMLETDPEDERFAAARQLVGHMESDKRAAIVVFNDTAQLVEPFVGMSGQDGRDRLNAALDGLAAPDGGTNFAEALGVAMTTIEAVGDKQRGKMVILLSDGFSDSDLEQQIANYQAQNVVVNTVGLNVTNSGGASLLQQIAESTGGSYYDVAEAGDLSLVFQNIYNNLDKQTLLTERTGKLADSKFYLFLRVLSLAIIGAAIGLSLGLVFDNRYLALSFGSGGAFGGLLAGFILDAGLAGSALSDGLTRLVAILVLAALIALFTLIVPIKDNVTTKLRVGGRSSALRDRTRAEMGDPAKSRRSFGVK